MSDFERQYAIRLPNGELFTYPEPESVLPSFMRPALPARKPRPAVFDTEADAIKILDQIRTEAAKVGVTNIGAVIISRVVGPWAEPDLDSFIAAVEGHANGDPS
ncbi:hypothetical protein R3Q06_31315 [Rhodococcus erythropolis]|uniref:hypothetical protein n=1 Tax=Rhodococcus erythropolis TaxID=1833 RepID=UPI0029490C5D|nr:hypothetical protein [Rhodococcus erythropolis]MDV6277975.1 hypothetical protein [Rhodococcus erythropolis]